MEKNPRVIALAIAYLILGATILGGAGYLVLLWYIHACVPYCL